MLIIILQAAMAIGFVSILFGIAVAFIYLVIKSIILYRNLDTKSKSFSEIFWYFLEKTIENLVVAIFIFILSTFILMLIIYSSPNSHLS